MTMTDKEKRVRNRTLHHANERTKKKRDQALQQFSTQWLSKRLTRCR